MSDYIDYDEAEPYGPDCLTCGNPPDYCPGGHGAPCEDCQGWLGDEFTGEGEAHEWACAARTRKYSASLAYAPAGVLALGAGGYSTDAESYRFFLPGVDPDPDYPAHIFLCETHDNGVTDTARLVATVDPYPDYTVNGHGGWTIA
ncbi:MAG: hypothetical protein M0R06_14780 [Sphaerochaeta sp.]|jgi:hypothetical protein|nr:hypothetical protein [Sphaerochaeta sp.]